MLGNGKRKITEELKSKIQMKLVNNEISCNYLKSASLTGVWVQVPPSALSPFYESRVEASLMLDSCAARSRKRRYILVRSSFLIL